MIGTCITQVISGILLICSVVKINKKMSLSQDADINIKTLILYSAAFSLYLVSITGYVTVYIFYLKNIFTQGWTLIIVCANACYNCCSFVSQCLLIVIFWQLGAKEIDESFETFVPIEV